MSWLEHTRKFNLYNVLVCWLLYGSRKYKFQNQDNFKLPYNILLREQSKIMSEICFRGWGKFPPLNKFWRDCWKQNKRTTKNSNNLFNIVHFSQNILKELITSEMVSQVQTSCHLNIHYFTLWNNHSSFEQKIKWAQNLTRGSTYQVISEGKESPENLY